MWRRLGQFILQYRFPLLIILAALTGIMGYWASKVQMSYDFARAIPTDNPKYRTYQEFKQKFGEDGNLVVLGIHKSKDSLFEEKMFNTYAALQRDLLKVKGVDDVISVPSAVSLVRIDSSERLRADSIFANGPMTQVEIDSMSKIFLNLPFYKHLLYSADTTAWLMGVRVNKQILNTSARIGVVKGIEELVNKFSASTNTEVYRSGLPLIRTELSVRIVGEMRWFLVTSVVLSALILLLFFRSFSSMLLSLAVVIIGVLWSMGTMHLLGYKITLLTGLIPPLLVVIGIPNCIYFLNKFHTSYNETGDKKTALVNMVGKMGIVTLFCNVAAAIGFAVFALTRSQILKEFGVVAGINIMVLFFISLVLIPAVLSMLPSPKSRHTKYLDNPRLNRWLDRLERWSLNHRKLIYAITVLIVAASVVGITRLKSVGYIVDDLPKTDKIYTDLKFFEKNFKGVMPLEIVVITEKRNGLKGSRMFPVLIKVDSLSDFLQSIPDVARPLSIAEGLKFVRQSFFYDDIKEYSLPSSHDIWIADVFSKDPNDTVASKNDLARVLATFMDTAKQQMRISVSMADVGSNRLPNILDSIQRKADTLFPKDKFAVQLTGTSVTFLEGSSYIINGLKESIAWAFLLIALCMLYLFRSFRILICSLIPNIIPLVITAGVMGWTGIAIKPSTVLVFSVALGIAIDVTIRFLVNYKQELPLHNHDLKTTVIETIHNTGISIIYTSLVLIAGFIIFCFSGFGGTQALGWLTSLTLVTATVTNLVLLPALLISMGKKKEKGTAEKDV